MFDNHNSQLTRKLSRHLRVYVYAFKASRTARKPTNISTDEFFYVVKRYLFSQLGEFSLYHSINENLMFLKRLWNTKIKLMNFNTSPSGNEIQVQTN